MALQRLLQLPVDLHREARAVSTRLLLCFGMVIVWEPATAAAQSVSGHLEGLVSSAGGQPLAEVEVIVDGTGLPGARLARTDRRGRFRLEQLPVGIYRAQLRLVGYRPVTLTGLQIRLGQTTTANPVSLEEMTVTLEEIAVTADRPLIDPASTVGGGSLRAEQFDALPIDRNYRALPTLLPGVNLEQEGLNVEGATGLENQFYIDGANVTNMNAGNSSTLLPPNFVQEIEVRTGGYAAEHRGTLGGNINVVTRSGGDRLSAETFGYLVSNQLTTDPRAIPGNTATGNFARYDAGASVSGPLARGRLWFFGAYAHSVEREGTRIPGFGTKDAETFRNTFAAKVTWQPGVRSTIVASVLGDPANGRSVGSYSYSLLNPDPLLGKRENGGTSVSLGWTYSATPRLVVQSSLSWVRQFNRTGPATARGAGEINFTDSNKVLSGGYPDQEDNVTHRLSAAVGVSYQAGAHQLKSGVEFSEQRVDNTYLGQWLSRDDTGNFFLQDFSQSGKTSTRLPSVFVQDGWALSNRLRLNYGLRWDGQYHFGSDGHISLAIKDQWQPRLGLVYLADREGKSRLYASYGRFYQDLQQSLGSLYFAYGSSFSFRDCPQDPRVDSTGCSAPSPPFTRGPNPDVKGQSFDEWSLGYDRALTPRVRARVRAVHRRLRWGIEDAGTANGFEIGNPGRGVLRSYPRMRREYSALELGVEGALTQRLWVLASYVISRTYGNHSGLYNSDEGYVFPNVNGAYDIPEILVNGTGRLPNDRPHVFKVNAAYHLPSSITVGTSLVWQSGAPINLLGGIPGQPPFYHGFEQQRGTAGRTPGTWDLEFRFSWAMDEVLRTSWQPRLLLDLYHVGSPRTVLTVDQVKFNGPNQTSPNPDYLEGLSFQPPMTARLGLVVGF